MLTAGPPGYSGRLITILWAGYFGLAPVVWFPGIGRMPILAAKTLLFALGVAMVWSYARDRSLPRGLLGPLGLGFLALASTFAVFQASSAGTAFRRLAEIVLAFAILWTFLFYERTFSRFRDIGSWAAAIHGSFSVLILLGFVGVIDSQSPGSTAVSLVDAGFGDGSTGWAAGVSLFVPFGAAAAMSSASARTRVLMGAAMVATTVGLFAIGARVGVVVSLISVALVGFSRFSWSFLFVFGASIASAIAIFWEFLFIRLHFDRISSLSFYDLDRFSAGRLGIYSDALDLIVQRPIRGLGFGVPAAELGLPESGIHNVWLRMSAEGGILLGMAFLAVAGVVVAKALAIVRRHLQSGRRSLGAVSTGLLAAILGGLILSLVEPNKLLGSMHTSSGWWAAAGVVISWYGTLHTRARGPGLLIHTSGRPPVRPGDQRRTGLRPDRREASSRQHRWPLQSSIKDL